MKAYCASEPPIVFFGKPTMPLPHGNVWHLRMLGFEYTGSAMAESTGYATCLIVVTA
jgi:hypothetical protein